MPGITRERFDEIQEAAQQLVASYGINRLDQMDNLMARRAILIGFAHELSEQQSIGYETARAHIAKACRRLRHPDYQPGSNWGGARYKEETNMTPRFKFTLADQSTQPYAWMTEGVDKADMQRHTPDQWVEDYARMSINAQNPGDDDEAVYKHWRNETDEYDQAVAYLRQWMTE